MTTGDLVDFEDVLRLHEGVHFFTQIIDVWNNQNYVTLLAKEFLFSHDALINDGWIYYINMLVGNKSMNLNN